MPVNTKLSASSHTNDCNIYRATDHLVSKQEIWSFQTEEETNPWFQMEFPEPREVIRVIVAQRLDNVAGGDLFKNVGIFVGNHPGEQGQLSDSQLCHAFQGLSAPSRIDVISCDQSMSGKYLTIQSMDEGLSQLTFSEILVHVTLDPTVKVHQEAEEHLIVLTGKDAIGDSYSTIPEIFNIQNINGSNPHCLHDLNLPIYTLSSTAGVLKNEVSEEFVVICGGWSAEDDGKSDKCYILGDDGNPFVQMAEKREGAASVVLDGGETLWITGGRGAIDEDYNHYYSLYGIHFVCSISIYDILLGQASWLL